MGAFFFKQPNGLYGRFSTVVDCPTHCNCTKEELIDEYVQVYREELERDFDKRCHEYSDIDKYFYPNNITKKKFKELKKLMETPIEELNKNRDG